MRVLAICALVAILGAIPSSRSAGAEFTVLEAGKTVPFDRLLDDLALADVVFVGEEHDHKLGHALELQILQGLSVRDTHIALGLEMFERDVQGILDEYLTGLITQSSFLAAARPWPNYKSDYAPMVEFCKDHGLPVIATNAPRRYVNVVSRKGIDALHNLPKASRSYLAPLPYSTEIPREYDRRLTEVFTEGHNVPAPPGAAAATSQPAGSQSATSTTPPAGSQPATSQPANPQSATSQPKTTATAQPAMPSTEHMKQAQELWDATMADSIAKFHRKSGCMILHINGSMHSDSHFGIADRLHRMRPGLKILVVTIRPSALYPQPPSDLASDSADFVIVTPEAPKPAAEAK